MIIKTALRYAFSKLHHQRRTSILIIIGLALGLMAMILIIGIMNFLQNSQLDVLRNTESFDISIENYSLSLDSYQEVEGVELAFEYLDIPVLLINEDTEYTAYANLRGIDSSLLSHPRYNLTNKVGQYIIPSYSVSSSLKSYNNKLKSSFLKKGATARLVPFTTYLDSHGYYFSSSSSNCLIDLSYLKNISGFTKGNIGLYIKDKANLEKVKEELVKIDSDAIIKTYKEANISLYSALMLEKRVVLAFLLFIIIIVSVNLFKSTKNMVSYKAKEAAGLQALGLSKTKVYLIFLTQAIIISLIGIVLGLILGLLASKYFDFIFVIIDFISTLITGSPTILSSVPFSIVLNINEISFFVCGILVLTLLFSFLGSKRAFSIQVMEILKDDK